MTITNERQARDKVWEMVKDIKIAQLITQSPEGLRSRPMSAIKREGDTLWFMTRDDSGKVDDIESNANVLLTYSNPDDQNYVSISGHASINRDREKINEFWTEFARVWFPKGPSDPAIVLVRVDAKSAEYWDSPSSSFVYAYGYAKARLTGKSPTNLGEVGHVDLKYSA